MLGPSSSWSLILNLIIHRYLQNNTICILWNEAYDFQLRDPAAGGDYASVIGIEVANLAESFEGNVVDAELKRQQLKERDLPHDELLLKLTMSIETSHCESFVAFGRQVRRFVAAFPRASMYSIWRSLRNKFVFVQLEQELNMASHSDDFYQDQPNILFVLGRSHRSSRLDLKTNKFVGPRSERPEQLELLDRYDARLQSFELNRNLFPDKVRNLQGRELTIAGFDYRPYTIIRRAPRAGGNARDVAAGRDSPEMVHIDGTETQLVLSFCEQFNCTVQIDTSDATDWGNIYANLSGDGALGMILAHKTDICIGSMYSWYDDYTYLDLSMYLVRSGITCLVPAPRRRASWYLPLQPFQWTLWAAVLVCLAIETFGLVLGQRSELALYATPSAGGWWPSFRFALIFTFKLFISQSGNSQARSVTMRVILFACFLNDIIITSIYGGGLASILTIPSLEQPADTLQRLHDQHLEWAGNSEAWVYTLRGSDDPLIRQLVANFRVYSEEELLQLGQRGGLAFTLERLPFGHFAIGDYLTLEAIEQLVIMQEDLYYQYTVAFVPRLWPLLEPFNQLAYRWHSSGFDKYWEYRVVAANLNRQIQQHVERTMPGNGLDLDGPIPLGMANFAGILLVWVLGTALALTAFAGERLWAGLRRQQKSK